MKSKPLSIRHTLWLAFALTVASTVLGISALHGYDLYRRARTTELVRARTIAETYAAQIGPLMAAGKTADMRAFIEQLTWHPSTNLVAILDVRGGRVVVRGAAELLNTPRFTEVSPTAQAEAWSGVIPGDPERHLPEFNLAVVPVRVTGSDEVHGTLVFAAAASKPAIVTSREVWMLLVYPILIATTGMLLGLLWLKRRVLDPLAMLSRRSRKDKADATTDNLPVDRGDEIGDLARTLADMRLDLEDWRTRFARLERSFSDRVAMETERITRELKKAETKVWTDPLTRLGNRRLLDEKFAQIFNAQRDSQKDLSLVMIDLDHFKVLNDTLGHNAGDDLLKLIGELLQQCLREQDLAVRYGGDEFLLILPSVSIDQAKAIADRTIALFAQQARILPVPIKPTMSAGIASLQENRSPTPVALLQMADAALYRAKAAGRGRSAVFKPGTQIVAKH